ncbi:MAG: hypothetical protein AAF081_03765 [Actinomycetota bacterium]
MNGTQLYEIVETYERLGVHRAGTDVDWATVEWVDEQLVARDLSTTSIDVPFDRYVAGVRLEADGVEITADPLFYEWTGSIDTVDVDVELLEPKAAGGRTGSLAAATGARRDAEALVIATDHPDGSLVGINRVAEIQSGRPTVLIAARDHDRVAGATEVRLRFDARLEPATTTNLEARNELNGAPLLITTPLTGWFTCAGERGTGLAVTLALAERFADRPMLVLATGAHELDYLGVRRWVASTPERPRAIVHVGASVAVEDPTDDGGRALVPTRLAMTDATGEAADRIGAALEPAGFHYRPGTDGWLGESEVFCEMGISMLSFTGSGRTFHTPEDLAARVTSPASLELVAQAIGDAVEALLDGS